MANILCKCGENLAMGPSISFIDKSLSQNHQRVWSPTRRRTIKKQSKVANRDWVYHQAWSLLQYIYMLEPIFKKHHFLNKNDHSVE